MRCEKKFRWVHVASSQLAILYTIHAKRGQEAMDEAGVLPLAYDCDFLVEVAVQELKD